MKELTAKDVAEIIFQSILESPQISEKQLVPTITALIKAFSKANNVILVEKKENKRLHFANEVNLKATYWQRKVKELDPENIEKYYQEVREIETKYRTENGLL